MRPSVVNAVYVHNSTPSHREEPSTPKTDTAERDASNHAGLRSRGVETTIRRRVWSQSRLTLPNLRALSGDTIAQIFAQCGRTLQRRRRIAEKTSRSTEMGLGTATVGSAALWCPFWAPQRLQEVISGSPGAVSGVRAHPLRIRRCSEPLHRLGVTFRRHLPDSYLLS